MPFGGELLAFALAAVVLVLWLGRELLAARRTVRLIEALYEVRESLDALGDVLLGEVDER